MDFKIHENTWWWGKSISIIESCGNASVDIKFDSTRPLTAYIEGLIVGIYSRKQGIATELMNLCEHFASERECLFLELSVDKEETWLVDWYKRLGFVIICIDEHEHLMTKKIDKKEIKKDCK